MQTSKWIYLRKISERAIILGSEYYEHLFHWKKHMIEFIAIKLTFFVLPKTISPSLLRLLLCASYCLHRKPTNKETTKYQRKGYYFRWPHRSKLCLHLVIFVARVDYDGGNFGR